MKILFSQKIWLVVFVIMTVGSIVGTIQQSPWVEKSIANYKYSFKILTGFYWTHKSVNENEITIIERSYLLFPECTPISIEKTLYNGSESIKVENSPINTSIGLLAYFFSMVISVKYLITICKKRRNLNKE